MNLVLFVCHKRMLASTAVGFNGRMLNRLALPVVLPAIITSFFPCPSRPEPGAWRPRSLAGNKCAGKNPRPLRRPPDTARARDSPAKLVATPRRDAIHPSSAKKRRRMRTAQALHSPPDRPNGSRGRG